MISTVKTLNLRFVKHIFVCLISLLITIFAVDAVYAMDSQDSLRIKALLYNASDRSINVIAGEKERFNGEYQFVKFSQPDRAIIDIPNAFLGTPLRTIPIHQNGIDRVELSQTVGTFYQVARITIFAENPELLNTLTVQPRDNMLTIFSGNIPLTPKGREGALLEPPLPPPQNPGRIDSVTNKTTVRELFFEDGSLKILADEGQPLSIKNQFTLNAPKRLVIDLANAVLADKRLTTPLDVREGPIQSVRLGQFDEDTVRIVVETPRPNALYIIYPGENRSLIALTADLTHSARTLPIENQNIGYIQDIYLTKREDGTVVRINTSNPMVRRISRHGDRIELDLINIASKPSFVAYDKREFPEIKEIKLNPLSAEEPNTRLIIKLDNSQVFMDSHLSLDGRALEIMLSSPYSGQGYISGRMPELILPDGTRSGMEPLPYLKRGVYTVVVDAGHGGKDLGANRGSVYEKYLNLSVAFKLKNALEEKGVTVYMTRSSDIFLELSQITAITNRIRPDAFISVHTNASVNSSINGIETYYYTTQSKELARKVHHRMINSISSPDRGVRKAQFYVIHHTGVPAILCETGYISNSSERSQLQTEARQQVTAEAIAQGVVEFLGREMKAEVLREESLEISPSVVELPEIEVAQGEQF